MTGDRTAATASTWSRFRAQHLYALAQTDESPAAWPSLPMDAFGCDFDPEADLDVKLIVDAVEVLSGPTDVELAATSVRIPATLRDLAHEVVGHGWVSSMSDLLVTGLRGQLAALTNHAINAGRVQEIREALDEHYAGRPDERADLVELAIAAAEIDGHPAAGHPDLVTQAVDDLGDDAYIEDVLAWVRGALAAVSTQEHS